MRNLTREEHKACKWQATIFEKSISFFPCGSRLFIFRYMKSSFAHNIDIDSSNYVELCPDVVLSMLLKKYKELLVTNKNKLGKNIMSWIGYMYRAISILAKGYKSSKSILKDFPVDFVIEIYDSYHTLSVEAAVERILDSVSNKKSDIEIQANRIRKFYI